MGRSLDHLMRVRLQFLTAFVARFVALALLCVSMSQRVVSSHLTSATLFHPPAIALTSLRAISNDLSAAVRVHRGDRILTVRAVTPLSRDSWRAHGSLPLMAQLERIGWEQEHGASWIERLPPAALRSSPARRSQGAALLRTRLPAMSIRQVCT